ncbi:TetR/AcrR family transcriptional regulator [Nocardia sp. NPDC056952]|uniref:TetR/AcrR family transcriptional regulator n=1 Tax=Nocardia sp. NPDC056952 TaxID=3345979 RepID=UPI003633C042
MPGSHRPGFAVTESPTAHPCTNPAREVDEAPAPMTTVPTISAAHRPASPRRIARRNQLLDTAQLAFATYGYHGVSMQMLSRRAGISKPVLYQHFSGKLDLYLTVVERYLDRLDDAIREVFVDAVTERDRIRGTVAVLFEMVDRYGELATHDAAFNSAVPSEPAVGWRIRVRLAQITGEIADQICRGQIDHHRSRMFAFGLVGAGLAAARLWWNSDQPIPRHEAVQAVADLFWTGPISSGTVTT